MISIKYFTLVVSLFLTNSIISQNVDVKNEVFEVHYSQDLEQPLKLKYVVSCTNGQFSRSGLDFYKENDIITSDNDDYRNNEWDKGHMAPAAAFSCSEETLKQTFSYLNCALQHETLNRGPWKELEGLERDLSFLYGDIIVEIEVIFSDNSERLPTGATVPDGFKKTIKVKDDTFTFYFDNKNVKGIDWSEFLIKN
jgi:DNA/RNA endonuclease G (NUC1)